MVFWYLLLQNTCIWLQWLGFEGKHAMLCIRGSNHHQALIRNMLVFQQSPALSSNLCILQAISHILGKSPCFLYKSGLLWCYFAKGIWWNFAYFPTKIVILLLCSIKSLHKIKILCLLHVCFSKLCLLWHFHSKMSNPMLHVMSSIYVQL